MTYSQVHKYWDIDTILIFLALYTTTMNLKWNEQDVLCVQTFRVFRVFTSKSVERWRNYNSFYMCLPLFKGPKVMGPTNNHKSNFHFLILGCKSFAVNYSLKSGMHRHYQMLGFIPGDAPPGLYCNCLQFLLVFSKWNACSIGFRSGDWLGHCITFHFFALKNSLVAFAVCFGSLSICTVKRRPISSEAFGWIWADNIARSTSEFILLLLSAITSSINTREPVPLAAIHAHAMTLPPPCFTDEVVCLVS